MESGCTVFVGCPPGYAFRRVEVPGWGTELCMKPGMGGTWPPEAQEHIFRATPPKVKGHLEVKLLWKCPIATKFGRKTPWLKCNALLGSQVMQGLDGVNQGSNCSSSESPMATKFGRKNPWSQYCIAGFKGHVGSAGVNQRSNCLEMPYSHQMWLMPLKEHDA